MKKTIMINLTTKYRSINMNCVKLTIIVVVLRKMEVEFILLKYGKKHIYVVLPQQYIIMPKDKVCLFQMINTS